MHDIRMNIFNAKIYFGREEREIILRVEITFLGTERPNLTSHPI